MKVLFNDLRAIHAPLMDDFKTEVETILNNSSFISGPKVASFENNFAAAHGANHCVCVNSGTAALHVALEALSIKTGDEVIVPSNTFIATAEAVSLTGATPIFCDCDANHANITAEEATKFITPQTKAVIAVHLFGQPAPMDELVALCNERKLLLIEDCAQAHLASYKGKPVGTFGQCGCFSFYPGKNLGACGEGGAVITNSNELAQKMKAYRDHGSTQKYIHRFPGHNYRMDGFQGAILDIKLRHLAEWTDKRRAIAAYYDEKLSKIKGVELIGSVNETKHAYHLYVIKVKDRDRFMKHLNDSDIQCGIHYPIPCHKQEAYAGKQPKLPNSETLAAEIVSLPMHPEMNIEQAEYVCKRTQEFF